MIQEAIACRRPRGVLRAEAPLLGEGRRWTPRRDRRRRLTAVGAATGDRRHRRLLRPVDAGAVRRRRRGGRRGPVAGGHRPALAVPARPRPGGGIGPPDRPAGRGLRGAAGVVDHRRTSPRGSPRRRSIRWPRRCSGWPATTPRTRRAGSRRCTCPTWTRCSTPSTAPWRTERGGHGCRHHRHQDRHLQPPDVGEGLTEAEILDLARRGRRRGHGEPDHRRDRDREGGRRAALAVRGSGARAAGGAGRDHRRRDADHPDRHRSGDRAGPAGRRNLRWR